MTETEKMLISMLTENTGAAMCDSGGIYGRHYERNGGRDFAAEPEYTMHVSVFQGKPEFCVTRSVFHFLNCVAEYDPEMQARFDAYVSENDGDNRYWLDLMKSFTDSLEDATGLDGDGEPMTVNTYNHDSMLSQVLQYRYFEIGDQAYALIQIHGGCDVRGGYTDPKAFRLIEGADLLLDAYASIFDGDNHWNTDDGYHWYFEGYSGDEHQQLETYPAVESEVPVAGHVAVTEDGRAFSPLNGELLFV